MSSVTRRIREIKGTKDAQPRGGYLPLKTFAIEEYTDDKLVSMSDENISASLVGTAVDYLTRLSFTDNAEEIINPYPDTNIGVFEICLKGAILLGQKRTKQWAFNAVSEIVADYAVNKKITDEMVVLACKLSGFDVVYRSSAWEYKPVSKINPNKKTISNIKTMIDRTSTYVSKCKPIIESGFIISDCGGKYVTVGDGDLLTENSIIDFKVSTRPPTSDHTLQLLIYYIAGLHKDFKKFKNVKKLVIFNPRLNISYTYNLHNLEDWIFNEVEKNIIGISPHKSFKKIPHC